MRIVRNGSIVLAIVALLSVAEGAHAQEGPSAPVAAWSAGFGWGLSSLTQPGAHIYTSWGIMQSGQLNAPRGVLLLERRLTERLSFMFQLAGAYQDLDSEAAAWPAKATSAGANVALRWVTNPGRLVEISPLISVGGRWSDYRGSAGWSYDTYAAYKHARQQTYTLDLGLGLVLERRLLDGLYLRFESLLAEARYGRERYRVSEAGSAPIVINSTLRSASATFAPSMELVMRF